MNTKSHVTCYLFNYELPAYDMDTFKYVPMFTCCSRSFPSTEKISNSSTNYVSSKQMLNNIYLKLINHVSYDIILHD